ncbi:glycosyltransferase [Pontibacter sp. SGAir0037]|uniref:glycosyltransferase n=1 Tax=Pontibacter sp. SGAir0037 TaxID=2571030 RepID=UPI0010CCEFEA|nr:glycosyltransferase [Pontibacter sp. SGAir0037]QCR24770.1 group 1 glycosyl transferase [Pontibacter sp. SGAir0037]
MKKVLIVAPYPLGCAPSQRFRFEQYLPDMEAAGLAYKFQPFWSRKAWLMLYRKGYLGQKLFFLLLGFTKRLWLLTQLPGFYYVLIHREATPVGPPWFEWVAAKLFRKKVIFDFDDAIWLPYTSAENKVASRLKWSSKTNQLCKWSYKVSCGNSYLQAYALQVNRRSVVLPTTIDMNYHRKPERQKNARTVIGWTGSHSTLPYLNMLEPVLQRLEQNYKFDFVVIADKAPVLDLKSLVYLVWQKDTEIQDLSRFDIGVMPLPDTEWAKGKCAFKALQYMALGIPAVVSAVGENQIAVPNGVAGYTCATLEEWYRALEKLLLQETLRARLGKAGREWVQENYSKQVYLNHFLRLFFC